MPVARAAGLVGAALALGGSAPGYPTADAVIAEINRARTDPAGYARSLRAYRAGFDADGIRHRRTPGAPAVPTLEGIGAVDEAIAVLADAKPVPALAPTHLLSIAANDLGVPQGVSGRIGHVGDDGSTPSQRVERRGGGRITVAEAISYGQADAEDVVRQLIVDAGVPSRGHRRVLLSTYFRRAGAWCGPHRIFGALCVVDLAPAEASGAGQP